MGLFTRQADEQPTASEATVAEEIEDVMPITAIAKTALVELAVDKYGANRAYDSMTKEQLYALAFPGVTK